MPASRSGRMWPASGTPSRAIEAGADGLILLTAGAGGQTGYANPFAFVRAVRAMFDGVIAVSGGQSDGWALWALQALGCDLGYMGTRFIATAESNAAPAYKHMIVDSELDDIHLTNAFSGLPTNMMRKSMARPGPRPGGIRRWAAASSRWTALSGRRRRAAALPRHLERRALRVRRAGRPCRGRPRQSARCRVRPGPGGQQGTAQFPLSGRLIVRIEQGRRSMPSGRVTGILLP